MRLILLKYLQSDVSSGNGLLELLPKNLKQMLEEAKKYFSKERGLVVGPSDLFDQVFDPEGAFSYVGTYTPKAREGQEINFAGGGVGDGAGSSGYRDLTTYPEGLWSEKLHQLAVTAIAMSPDGNYLISASDDNTVKRINLRSGEEKSYSHLNDMRRITFSPDGKYLASWLGDGTVKLMDLQSGEEKAYDHDERRSVVAFSPDGKYLISGSENGTVQLIDLRSGEKKLYKHPGSKIWTVALSADGKYLAAGTRDGTVKLLDLQSGEEKLYSHNNGWVRALVFSADGKYLASGSANGTMKLTDLQSGEEKSYSHEGEGSVFKIVFSADGKYFASGSSSGAVRLMDLQSGEEKLYSHNGWVRALVFSPNGKYLASGSGDNTVKLINLQSGEEKSYSQGSWALAVTFSQDSSFLATADESGGVHLFSTTPLSQENLTEKLSDYDKDHFIGEAGVARLKQKQFFLKLLFMKSKKHHQMTYAQAFKLMNQNITRADYKGFLSGAERAYRGDDAHIFGVINEVFDVTDFASHQSRLQGESPSANLAANPPLAP